MSIKRECVSTTPLGNGPLLGLFPYTVGLTASTIEEITLAHKSCYTWVLVPRVGNSEFF